MKPKEPERLLMLARQAAPLPYAFGGSERVTSEHPERPGTMVARAAKIPDAAFIVAACNAVTGLAAALARAEAAEAREAALRDVVISVTTDLQERSNLLADSGRSIEDNCHSAWLAGKAWALRAALAAAQGEPPAG